MLSVFTVKDPELKRISYHLLQRSSEVVVTLSLANVEAAIFEQTAKAF